LQDISKGIEGLSSVSSLAGYEVLTEGRGSNAGACLINLKNCSERKLTSKQIIQVPGGLVETQGVEGPVHLLCQQLPAV
jgi:hypothetical protein